MGIEICFAKASKVVGERGRKMVDQWVNIIADDLGPALFLRLHIYPGRTARQLVSQASLRTTLASLAQPEGLSDGQMSM